MIKILISTAVFILCTIPAMAKESPDPETQAITSAVQQLHQAMMDADSAGLNNLTADELTYGHSTGAVEDRETFIKNLSSGKTRFKTIEFLEPDIRIKKNVAWVRGNLRAEILNNAGTDQIAFKILYVFVLENGTWKLLARQSVK